MLRAFSAHPCTRGGPLPGLHVCALPGDADILEISLGYHSLVHAVCVLAIRHSAPAEQLPVARKVPCRSHAK